MGYYSAGGSQWLLAYVPWSGRELAKYASTTSFNFFHPNMLGSAGISTDQTGTVDDDMAFYPWGQVWLNSGSNTYDTHFAGIHAALQGSNLIDFTMDEAPYRFYAPNPGRWHSPDPLAGDITNPQSLNLYAYALNNPTTLIDPSGLSAWPCGCGMCTAPDPFPLPPGTMGSGGGAGGGSGHSPTYNKEKCEQALETARASMAGVQRALNNWSMIEQAAVNHGVDPTILAAMAIRESNFQNIPQNGFGTYEAGMGIFQIDARAFPNATSFAYDPAQAANFAAGLVGTYYRTNVFNGMDPTMALGVALRSYNAGPGGLTPVLAATGWPGYLDIGTSPGNPTYVSNVAAIAAYCF